MFLRHFFDYLQMLLFVHPKTGTRVETVACRKPSTLNLHNSFMIQQIEVTLHGQEAAVNKPF